MEIGGLEFDWDEGNRERCQTHGLSIREIESLFQSPLSVFPDPEHSREEERFIGIGKTDEDRSVFIVFTLRRRETKGCSFVQSARGTCTRKRSITLKKKLPRLKSDAEAEAFVDKADLTQFDLSEMRELRFELGPKTERVNMRLPKPLLDAVKARAARQKIPYQRYIRAVLEQAVGSPERKGPRA
jgi:predicted DNA binding CopG/RHH family protein